mmetsp:Transcript_26367/g.56045  ORF Transcript_26367/g.56045 Transcript_26367/m.56045 type:complete len:461 (-) Transcript_26367:260-1642(-)|eukprot:CAMPEP_0172568346 /NCGR_PEP_ID=MMETSP1067-20121228/119642_1 /TAXON_ID=265564 ORGANISM="Thalassiosira punctigera, Strain Tpunct2005C2" /NCGR_SAMPLE_ID=MMETSP1067 /ASSEMBLY_ACC=CAM_ASM_000444 /LENGTH=460 /DNA_ID=CAMNT_0013359923 /DNA_START=164 /DNA_END=1546 /DNA_ORIENTATION=+
MAPRPSILYGGLFLCFAGTSSAFHNPPPTPINLSPIRHPINRRCSNTALRNDYCVDLSEDANRDINSMHEWAYNYGVQQHEGFALTSWDGYDFFAMAGTDIPAETCVLYVPANLYLTSYGSLEEFGKLEEAEKLIGSLAGADEFPLFYLFLKVLVEYERGQDSPWFSWLNSLPRLFNNGAAMTPSCYDCLPPLGAKLSMAERIKHVNCRQALKLVDFVSEETKKNEELTKWVYNVVATRSLDVGGEKIIIPMADMFNHGSDGHEVEISYDEEGSCVVYTNADVPAGSPLRISYGDYYLTNPSATFAKYGFIDETCPSTFCKMMDIIPSTELRDIGLSFSRMLFYKDTGEVSEEVYDVLLYQILSNNRQAQTEFYNACMNGDAATKSAYHQQYLGETMGKLKKHVDEFLIDLDQLSEKAARKDLAQHPRLPLIMAHNEFVRQTFLRVKEKVDPIVAQAAAY